MTFRNVSLVLMLCSLLAGCDTYYAARRDLGIDPVDPPVTPATTMSPGPVAGRAQPESMAGGPAPNREGIAQADWAAQRTATLTAQANTPPVGYKPEPPPANASLVPVPPAKGGVPDKTSATKPGPAMASAPAKPKPVEPAPGKAMQPPAMPLPAAGLPAGYRPSPSAVDHPQAMVDGKGGAASMQHAAPAMADMKDGGSHPEVWRAHLASHRTEEAAINEWEGLLKASPKLYGQYDPMILWTDIPNRGAFARLTMGEFADRKAAETACETVRRPGHYCAPLKE